MLGQKNGEIFPRHVLGVLSRTEKRDFGLRQNKIELAIIGIYICPTFNTPHPICMCSWNALQGRFSLHTAGKEMPDQVGHDGVIRSGMTE